MSGTGKRPTDHALPAQGGGHGVLQGDPAARHTRLLVLPLVPVRVGDVGEPGREVDGDDLVEELGAEPEGLGSGLAHGDAVGEQADGGQHHPFPGRQGSRHAGGIVRLDADDLGLGPQVFHEGGDASGEPSRRYRTASAIS